MGNDVSGKSIIVTGAGRGIGAGIAKDLAEKGASVCVADLNEDAAKNVAAKIGHGAIGVGVNVADRASTKAMIDATVEGLRQARRDLQQCRDQPDLPVHGHRRG